MWAIFTPSATYVKHKMDEIIDSEKPPKSNHEELNNLNRPITKDDIEIIIKHSAKNNK